MSLDIMLSSMLYFFSVCLRCGDAHLKAEEESDLLVGENGAHLGQAHLDNNLERMALKRRRMGRPWRPLKKRRVSSGPVWNRKLDGCATTANLTESMTETQWPYCKYVPAGACMRSLRMQQAGALVPVCAAVTCLCKMTTDRCGASRKLPVDV